MSELKKMLQKLSISAAALGLFVGLSLTGLALTPETIVILHTNDVHCAVDGEIGYANVAALKKDLQKQYGEGQVVLVDAGDAIQGGVIGTLSDGAYPLELMNAAGYDFAIPGNHEFDYTVERFMALTKQAKFPYLSSNFTDLSTGKLALPAYQIKEQSGMKVAYLGITTPESLTKSAPVYFQDKNGNYRYGFCQGESGQSLYRAVQQSVDAARKEGAELVVAIGHLGLHGVSPEYSSASVIANTSGIDVLIDGHSHEQYQETRSAKDGKPVVLIQTGTKLSAIGKVVIEPATRKITSELVTSAPAKDAAVEKTLAEIQAKYDAVVNQVVAKTAVPLVSNDLVTGLRLVRSQESNLGDLCADAYRVMTGADVGFINGGGIRADIAAGEITYGNIIDVNPYNNAICMIEATGQQIVDALEFGARFLPEENGGFLQVSGVSYTIDLNVTPSIEIDAENRFIRVTGPRRVGSVEIGGKPVDLQKTYTLASHNYMLKQGGDGFSMFSGNQLVLDEVMLDHQALIRYIAEHLGGMVGADYTNPLGQGRITIIAADNVISFPAAASATPNASTGAAA